MSSLPAAERETTVTMSDDSDMVLVWTCQRKSITALRKRESATEINSGFYGTTEWAEFQIPADRFNIAQAVRPPKRKLSEEERQAIADRFAEARQKQ